MPDYQNGKIYSIRSHQTDKFYIGSTCSPLYKRLYQHRNYYNKKKIIVSSYEIIKFDDHYIELIEDYKCERRDQLIKREGELIRENINNVVNIKIMGRTKKESDKIYKDVHRDEIKKKRKEYYIKNKDVIIEKVKQWRNNRKDN
jgi:hypothetical protein